MENFFKRIIKSDKNNMDIEFGFNSKSSSTVIRQAIKLASEIGYTTSKTDSKIYVIKTNQLNEEIKELIKLTGHLSKSYLIVNNEEVFNIVSFLSVATCNKYNLCNGACTNEQYQYYLWNNIFEKIGIEVDKNMDDSIFSFFNYGINFINNQDLFVSENEKEILIGRDILRKEYLKSTEYIRKYCDKFNADNIIKRIDEEGEYISLKKDIQFDYEQSNELEEFEDNDDESQFLNEENKIIDLTSKVERMEVIEKKLGISFSGIYCSVETNEYSDDISYAIECNGEIMADELEQDILIKCSAFDEKGRVLGENTTSFYCENFSGYDTFNISFNVNAEPFKCKIFVLKN